MIVKPYKPEGVVVDAAPKRREAPRRGDLSPDQLEAYDTIRKWIDDPTKNYISLGGLAGTGKTTLVSALATELRDRRIVFTAFTGKAVDVLGRKLRSYGIDAPCRTLHSLLYKPQIDGAGNIIGWELRDELGTIEYDEYDRPRVTPYDLVVLDEASMVGSDLWRDLCSFDVPIVAVGDHGQLPPIGTGSISLMLEPDLRLEKIHRQAEGNPIISLAHYVREGGDIRLFRTQGDGVRRLGRFAQAIEVVAQGGLDAAGICAFNNTRVKLNELCRQQRQYEGPDTVICLRNSKPALFNGMRGLIIDVPNVEPTTGEIITDSFGRTLMDIAFPENEILVQALVQMGQFGRQKSISSIADVPNAKSWHQIGELFDFGYVLTCHKAQGSQWKDVVIQYEASSKSSKEERIRWLYTAITRASERVHIAA